MCHIGGVAETRAASGEIQAGEHKSGGVPLSVTPLESNTVSSHVSKSFCIEISLQIAGRSWAYFWRMWPGRDGGGNPVTFSLKYRAGI